MSSNKYQYEKTKELLEVIDKGLHHPQVQYLRLQKLSAIDETKIQDIAIYCTSNKGKAQITLEFIDGGIGTVSGNSSIEIKDLYQYLVEAAMDIISIVEIPK